MQFMLVLAVFIVAFLYVYIFSRLRARTMRLFARRWDFQYTAGKAFRWPWRKSKRLPEGLRIKGHPANLIRNAWNILDGEINGIRVVIFDSEMGQSKGRGWYSTVVAVQTGQNPFGSVSKPEKVSSGQEWKLLYSNRFLQTGWTLSTERLDVIIGSLYQALEP